MLRGGEVVLVAVSGGPDSVALLDVLCALREPLALRLTVVHVHHGLRPEADAEADGVRALCERLACLLDGSFDEVRDSLLRPLSGEFSRLKRLRVGGAAGADQRMAILESVSRRA